jgi:LPXTG-motif cell wall-anchored protein
MKKILSFISIFVATGALLASPAYAMRLSPNTGTFAPLAEQTIAIVASPSVANAKGAQIRLTVTNATVIADSYSESVAKSLGYLSIGVCPGSAFTTETQVCVDTVRTNDAQGNERFVTEGNILGEFRVKFNSGVSSATIVTGTDSAYLVGSNLTYNNGQTLGTYTVGTAAVPTLPVTGLGDSPVFMIMAGVGIVSLGILFLLWRDKLQKSYN